MTLWQYRNKLMSELLGQSDMLCPPFNRRKVPTADVQTQVDPMTGYIGSSGRDPLKTRSQLAGCGSGNFHFPVKISVRER